ncbi:7820_t:CDS:2 [Paraglomus occultum]|uniref:7820_t:CDS:1 n=1 Tax=Paraglomus occultum TaxID=144539 RepID=A0A9N9BMW5_9GLOM|nr:7820_t:CDS:2 [Paraglomus occultum]
MSPVIESLLFPGPDVRLNISTRMSATICYRPRHYLSSSTPRF